IERSADERVNADGLAFNQCWLERLNAEAVQRWSAVQQHRMLADHVFQDVPHDGLLLLDHFLGLLDGGAVALGLELVIDEGFEKLEAQGHCTTIKRSEEHTSELQSLAYLVCRLLLEKKKIKK